MIQDEREESLREMAALGNLRAVTAYARAGVDLNSQNKINGWTALHWASKRGTIAVVEFLIRAGADTEIKNGMGQTPRDVSKSEVIRAAFPGYNPADEPAEKEHPDSESAPSFVPNYIVNPDLSKAWDVPEDALQGAHGDSAYGRQLQHEASVRSSGAVPPPTQEAVPPSTQDPISSSERELLVYNGHYGDGQLLGSVFVDPHAQTVADLGTCIREELDAIPASFTFARHNGKQAVPVSAKQESFAVARVFRGADDAVILCPTAGS
ncbi:hypothetical protein GGF46_000947 [Coemansia sp. RSA 552]|nr:hypothetical protein GGF46_000947 [Coemansia sp. RSA 552]